MSRVSELRDTLFLKDDNPYGRIFVVSAFGGITDLLLEHKKSGKPGVYAQFANADNDRGWHEALDRVADAMAEAHEAVLDHGADTERAEDARVQPGQRLAGAQDVGPRRHKVSAVDDQDGVVRELLL